MNVEVLPHDFCKLQPLKLYRIVQEPFFQAWKLFSAEIWKMSVFCRANLYRFCFVMKLHNPILLFFVFCRANLVSSSHRATENVMHHDPRQQEWSRQTFCICLIARERKKKKRHRALQNKAKIFMKLHFMDLFIAIVTMSYFWSICPNRPGFWSIL